MVYPIFSPAPPPYHPFLGVPYLGEVKGEGGSHSPRLSQSDLRGGVGVVFKSFTERSLYCVSFSKTTKISPDVFALLKHRKPVRATPHPRVAGRLSLTLGPDQYLQLARN